MASQALVESTRTIEMIKELIRKDLLRETNIGFVQEVLVTKHSNRYGIEIKIDCPTNDGTQSWVVISRDVEKYVTELALGHTQPMHHAEVPTQAHGDQLRQSQGSSSSSMNASLPVNQQRWENIPPVPGVDDENCYQLSKNVANFLRHCDIFREANGAIEWRKLLSQLDREGLRVNVSNWRTKVWLDHLERGSNKKIFEDCLDSSGNIL